MDSQGGDAGRRSEPEIRRRRVLRATAGIGTASVAGLSSAGSARAAGGDKRWQFEAEWGGSEGTTVVGDTVFAVDAFGQVYALDADTGDQQWRIPGGGGAPAVRGGLVYMGRKVVKVHYAETGDRTWQFEPDDLALASPIVVDDTVFCGSTDNRVYALDVHDGSEKWRFETGDSVNSSPTVVNGTVFVGSDDDNLYALDATDGTEQWRFETGDSITSSPTEVDGTVFVGSDAGAAYAVDAFDGTEVWEFKTGGPVSSSPTVLDGTVYVGCNDDNLYALDATDGTEQWRFETGDSVYSSPTVAGGTVFVGSEDANVYAVDANDGSEKWRFETGDKVRSSPTVVDGTVFVVSHDHNVYALDAGVDGSSEGSRVLLGTLGHHEERADRVTTTTPARFEVAVETNAPVDPGEELTLEVEVTNVGDQSGTRSFDIDAQPFAEETHSVLLGSGDNVTTTLGFDVRAEHVGEHDVTVSSAVDTATTTVTVLAPPTTTGGRETTGTDTSDGQGAAGTDTTGGVDTVETGDEIEGSETAAEGPGFGVTSALTGLAGYLLSRRLFDRDA